MEKNAFCRDVDGHRLCHIEWSKSEREKQILFINVYIQNLDKQHWWNYLPVTPAPCLLLFSVDSICSAVPPKCFLVKMKPSTSPAALVQRLKPWEMLVTQPCGTASFPAWPVILDDLRLWEGRGHLSVFHLTLPDSAPFQRMDGSSPCTAISQRASCSRDKVSVRA